MSICTKKTQMQNSMFVSTIFGRRSVLSPYIEFWKLGMSKDNLYSRVMGLYVKYWGTILELLSKTIPQQSSIILESFWPFNNWKANYECASIRTIADVDPEEHVIPPYYGPRSIHPSLKIATYMPFCDLFASNFFFMRPLDLTI